MKMVSTKYCLFQERNYHIFYCMLSGLSKEHKDRLHLKDASNYKYLTGVGSTSKYRLHLKDASNYKYLTGVGSTSKW